MTAKTVRIEHGDCLDVMARLLGSRHPLNERVGAPVARFAERGQVLQGIRLSVIDEQPERPDVVDVRALLAAMLTDAAVTPFGLAFLRGPIRAAVALRSALVLRMKDANARLVAAGARAVFALSAAIMCVGGHPREGRSAADARQSDALFGATRDRCILAGWRAGLPASVLSARRDDTKRLSTPLANRVNGLFHALILGAAA